MVIKMKENKNINKNIHHKSYIKVIIVKFTQDTREDIIKEKKEAYLNGIKQISPRKFLGEFQAVVFSPSVLSVIRDGPSEKRKFLDIAISLIRPNYAALLSKYNKTIIQRNSLLKQIGTEKKGRRFAFCF